MFQKVSAYVEKNHMLSAGDFVVAGVSGGADSVCLLLVLFALQKEISFGLEVVHVNHKIRPEAAKDAAFVQDLCRRLDVPFHLAECDVEALAKEWGVSTEEAGRKVRYDAFKEVAAAHPHAKIAVAHNLNDRAETMLFNLFRGSGLTGLCSIRPVRNDEIPVIRPLLSVTRNEIEDFLKGKGMGWCEDVTNAEDVYTRNRIRHHILPYAGEHVAPGVIANMGRAADILTETEDFVKAEVEQAYNDIAKKEDAESSMVLDAKKAEKLHVFLQKQLVLRCLEELTPARKDITHTHVEDIVSLFSKSANREISLPYGITARREYDRVIFEKESGGRLTEQKRQIPMPVELPDIGNGPVTVRVSYKETMEFSVFNYEQSLNIPQNQYTKWFDYDKIEKSLTIRTRAAGDYLTINAALSKKTIQDYMVEEKIPKAKRDEILLLAEDKHILWVVGHRISSKYKIDETTKRILQVQIGGGL